MGNKKSILEELTEKNQLISAPCNGKGSCGKCRIRCLEGTLPVTAYDQATFTQEELEAGFRLACKAYSQGETSYEVCVTTEETFAVLGLEESCDNTRVEGDCHIAIDVGTTTIAMCLVEQNTGAIVSSYTCVNSQRKYGSDVITRIQAANEGSLEVMQECVKRDVEQGIVQMCRDCLIEQEQLSKVVIVANTTMIHLLMGYSCDTLGVYPFTPFSTDIIEESLEEVVGNREYGNAKCIIFPSISAYIGADIVAGIYQLQMYCQPSYTLLLDLGTNGEMALCKEGTVYVASTALGPACEGGNISCGVGSIHGAISSVRLDGEVTHVDTIGGKPPIGVCGTGILEGVAQLFHSNYIDATGLLEERYFEKGFPLGIGEDGSIYAITQQDIREIQLVKSAIRAGIETLLRKANVSYEEISHVYLAGGFGVFLAPSQAVLLGLFPKELEQKLVSVGNAALNGAIAYAQRGHEQELERIIEGAKEVELALSDTFMELYVEHMNFL
ncbi:MAG: ASKHA domain-containing protein [Eubacteriales bacterium]